MRIQNLASIILITIALSGCKIEITTPTSGSVASVSGAFDCEPNSKCVIDVSDVHFIEIFQGIPVSSDYRFLEWRKRDRGLCGGNDEPCELSTQSFGSNESLMTVLRSSETFYLEPVFVPVSDEVEKPIAKIDVRVSEGGVVTNSSGKVIGAIIDSTVFRTILAEVYFIGDSFAYQLYTPKLPSIYNLTHVYYSELGCAGQSYVKNKKYVFRESGLSSFLIADTVLGTRKVTTHSYWDGEQCNTKEALRSLYETRKTNINLPDGKFYYREL